MFVDFIGGWGKLNLHSAFDFLRQVWECLWICLLTRSPSSGILQVTRRLAASTQAVITLRSTSYIAIELKCSAFQVIRNSIESMCLSYSVFDWISWNRLIAYYSFTDLKQVKGVKIVISAYERFSLFSLAFAVVCLFVFSFLKQERHFEFQSYGGAWHRATLGLVNLFKIIQGISQVWENSQT